MWAYMRSGSSIVSVSRPASFANWRLVKKKTIFVLSPASRSETPLSRGMAYLLEGGSTYLETRQRRDVTKPAGSAACPYREAAHATQCDCAVPHAPPGADRPRGRRCPST